MKVHFHQSDTNTLEAHWLTVGAFIQTLLVPLIGVGREAKQNLNQIFLKQVANMRI